MCPLEILIDILSVLGLLHEPRGQGWRKSERQIENAIQSVCRLAEGRAPQSKRVCVTSTEPQRLGCRLRNARLALLTGFRKSPETWESSLNKRHSNRTEELLVKDTFEVPDFSQTASL